MKKTKNKKGFTLVELVVVIAIIAILGAVSVVGYFAFIEKANKSADEQLCTQYNTILKAASVEDDDITLPELVTLIEENGIRSNQFKTVSKGYVFAYNKTGKEVVLLDKDSGTPAFPTKSEAHPEDLWASMDSKFKYQKGVNNYALYTSATYVDPADSSNEYTFDLNNHVLRFNESPKASVKTTNGTIVEVKEGLINITPDATTKKIDNNKALIATKAEILDENLINNRFDTKDKIQTLKGEFISSSDEKVEFKYSPTGIKKLVFEDCVFDNVRLTLSETHTDIDVVVKNCKFCNIESYALHTGTFKSMTVSNNVVEGLNRGFAFNPAKETTVIENNTFELDAIETSNKGERKDNAVQFMLDNPTEIYADWSTEKPYASNFKVTVRNNIVNKAAAFITLHAGWCTKAHVANTNQKLAIKNSFTVEHFLFENNTIKSGIKMLTEDPGVYTEQSKDEQSVYDEIFPVFKALVH